MLMLKTKIYLKVFRCILFKILVLCLICMYIFCLYHPSDVGKLCITCASPTPQTLGGVQEKGTIENGAYPYMWRDDHTVNSQAGLPSEHDGREIWRVRGLLCIYVCYILPMDNYDTYIMLCMFEGCFPIDQLGSLMFMPIVRYYVGVSLI